MYGFCCTPAAHAGGAVQPCLSRRPLRPSPQAFHLYSGIPKDLAGKVDIHPRLKALLEGPFCDLECFHAEQRRRAADKAAKEKAASAAAAAAKQ